MLKEIHLKDNLYVQVFYDSDAASPDEFSDACVFVVDIPNRKKRSFENLTVADITEIILNPSLDNAWLLEENDIFPVTVHIHSGTRLKLSSSKTSDDAYVVIPKDAYYVLNNILLDEIANYFIKLWEHFYNGTVYMVNIVERHTCTQCQATHDTVVDSCVGIYENLDNITKDMICQMI